MTPKSPSNWPKIKSLSALKNHGGGCRCCNEPEIETTQMEKAKTNSAGFTLMELMVVVGIMGLMGLVAMPGAVSWLDSAKLRSAAANLRGDLELAKLRAIRENNLVALQVNDNGYTVWVDNGAGGVGAGDWICSGDETVLSNRVLAGARIDHTATTLDLERTRFNGWGMPANTGEVVFDGNGGRRAVVTIFATGRVVVE